MEQLLTYEAIKQIVVMTAFWFILMMDVYVIGWVIITFLKWIWKMLKKLFKKKTDEQTSSGICRITRCRNPSLRLFHKQ